MSIPFFQPNAARFTPALDALCRSCPQAQRGGFCGARIHPDCLRIDREGTVRVSLSAPPQTWFKTICEFGEVLHMTRNPIGVLGRMGNVPTLRHWRKSPLLTDETADLLPNLAEYASLWAIRENSPLGTFYGLEVRDPLGTAFERIILPADADHASFSQFVVNYQSPPEETGSWFSPNHSASASRRAQLARRIPRLRSQCEAGDLVIRKLPIQFVSELLASAARSQTQIRTTFFHPALIRSITWTPQIRSETTHGSGAIEFIHSDSSGLHLDRRSVASAWLWTGRCPCCAKQRWRVEIGDARDIIGLGITAAASTPEGDWRAVINECLQVNAGRLRI